MIPFYGGEERGNPDRRAVADRTVYEPRVAPRRIQSALLALAVIVVAGVLGYMVFEGWSFTDALDTVGLFQRSPGMARSWPSEP